MTLQYIYATNSNSFSLLREIESKALFSHKTGGRGHWHFIIESEYIPNELNSIVNWECNWEQFQKFLMEYYPDCFFIPSNSEQLAIFVKESKVGWIIGKGGWRIKKLRSFFGKITLIPVKLPNEIHWWYGYGRNNMVLEKSLCNNCNQMLNNTTRLNAYFFQCNKCKSINVIK